MTTGALFIQGSCGHVNLNYHLLRLEVIQIKLITNILTTLYN